MLEGTAREDVVATREELDPPPRIPPRGLFAFAELEDVEEPLDRATLLVDVAAAELEVVSTPKMPPTEPPTPPAAEEMEDVLEAIDVKLEVVVTPAPVDCPMKPSLVFTATELAYGATLEDAGTLLLVVSCPSMPPTPPPALVAALEVCAALEDNWASGGVLLPA